MSSISLNTSYKHHGILGLIIGLWLVVFLVFIAPFDVADLDLQARLELLPPYAILVFIGYMLAVIFQNYVYKIKGKWNVYWETLTILITVVFIGLICFPYYKSNWVRGTFNFIEFISIVYAPIALIISFFIIFGRMYLNKLQAKKERSNILLKGTAKTDVLQVDPNNILCVSGAQNYVEVHYLINGERRKKLLRITLKSIQSEVTELIQVHRSHYINLAHFTKWVDSNTIQVYDLEIPVSKKFKQQLKELI